MYLVWVESSFYEHKCIIMKVRTQRNNALLIYIIMIEFKTIYVFLLLYINKTWGETERSKLGENIKILYRGPLFHTTRPNIGKTQSLRCRKSYGKLDCQKNRTVLNYIAAACKTALQIVLYVLQILNPEFILILN